MKPLTFPYERSKYPDAPHWLASVECYMKNRLHPSEMTPDHLPVARILRRLRWEWISNGQMKFGEAYLIPGQFGFWGLALPVFNDCFWRYGEWPDGISVVAAIFNQEQPLFPDRPLARGGYDVKLFAPIPCVNNEIADVVAINKQFMEDHDNETWGGSGPYLSADDQTGVRDVPKRGPIQCRQK